MIRNECCSKQAKIEFKKNNMIATVVCETCGKIIRPQYEDDLDTLRLRK